ncbi:TIGR04024 family LLM class F420-dependent oxidoreductase [Natrinema halophilum]|uniref:TIGR04024 family LLM class F420-dependent oxidoreductase n=1 Tax=Natrinema halophilum TaxID=1699371 RepID=UPI001F226E5C|nr:TIGR04024 family LLM class F420-dependent oxidoreductase [Natrinema halophilum]UHQ96305.1 TIGR04024 family LLM class F420-dependent oxidoreductase [Natrinema halophilum]
MDHDGTEIDVRLQTSALGDLETITSFGTLAESLGYDRVWIPETWGIDAVTVSTLLAERTDELGIGVSIFPTYSRSPALVGQTAATLQAASGGRFRVGLGPSGPAVIENWHGIPFERPLRRTREYVEIVTQVLAGETVSYDGTFFELSGFRLRCDPPEDPPGVDVAAMGPKAVELTGRFADGWHALMLTPDGLRDRASDLRRGASAGDRDPADIHTTLTVPCCVLEDAATARDLARGHIAFYVGAMGTFYRDALIAQGYEDIATEIHDAWQAGETDRARQALDDDLLDSLAIAGTADDVRPRLEAFTGVDVVDAVSLYIPSRATNDQVRETMETVARCVE